MVMIMNRKTKVLVVDDDRYLQVIGLYLEKKAVSLMAHGKSGLEVFVDSAPSIVMPNIICR